MPERAIPSPFGGSVLDFMSLAGLGGADWEAWRTFWKTVFGLRLNKSDKQRFAKHAGGRSIPKQRVAEAWQLIGRRGGKSRNAAMAAAYLAISRDYRLILAPGEVAVIPIIAADRKQARQVLNYLKGISRLPAFEHYVSRELSASVEFKTGVTVEIATASYRTTRGYTIPAIIADEMAFWRSDDSAEPDTEVLDALRGGMLTVAEPLLLVLSTPYARKGELYKAYQSHYGKDTPHILVWNADTVSMHPGPNVARYVAQKFEDDPIVAASEYGRDGSVLFRKDVEGFVDPAAIAAVTVNGRYELPPEPGVHYYAFTDPSGGSQDAWALAIAHWNGTHAVLDLVRDVPAPFSPSAVVEGYALPLKQYRVTQIQGDHYGGEFPRELFRKHGITYRVSEYTKSDLYREVLPAINTGAVELLEHKTLRVQFCQLERHVARSGQDTIDHPPGGHDDVCNAVSGALVLAARRPSVTITRVAL